MTLSVDFARKIPGSKIMVLASDGNEYVLNHVFAHRDDPKLFETLTRVRAAKVIDLRYWRKARKGEC